MVRRRWPGTAHASGPAAGPDGRRRHGAVRHGDRFELECAGWRTTLEYCENLVRDRDGRLRRLEVLWRAEAEREGPRDGGPVVIWARGSTIDSAWSRLRLQAGAVDAGSRSAAGGEDPHRRDAPVTPAAPV